MKLCREDTEGLEKNLKNHVIELSKNIGERNYLCYEALNEASLYILAEFKKYGYESQIQSYYIQNRMYKNIIAVKKGNEKPEEIIVIGAHYDSVVGSPGADDNGSGLAALLELSRLFFEIATDRTIKFIAFVNEEPPFFLSGDMGSRVYARDAKKRHEDIKAMVCLESVGYFSEERKSQSYPLWYGLFYPNRGNFIGVVGNFTSRELVRRIEDGFKRNSNFGIITAVVPEFVTGVNFSDHDSFWKYGYKACMVTDTAFYRYPYYHTPEDTHEKLDYGKLTEVVKGLYGAMLELSGHRDPNPSWGNSAFMVPIGEVDKVLLENLAKVLNEIFNTQFKIKESLQTPVETFDSERSQFNSSMILDGLRPLTGKKILGIIDKDLYVRGLNFVFGQAESPGKCALISITRLRQEFYKLPKDDKIFFERVVKEAVHELGHTYGLKHCSRFDCAMYFSNNIVDTDRKGSSFCKRCHKGLRLWKRI